MKSFVKRYARVGLALFVVVLVLAALPGATQAAARPVDSPQTRIAENWFGTGCTYVVQPGDNLFRIGLRFGTSAWVLAAMNGLPNVNLVFAGMVLRVPCSGGFPAPFPIPFPSPVVFPPTTGVCSVHFVRFGETLTSIAFQHGVSVWSIVALNHLPNANFIFVGERLLIPCGGFGFDP